MTLEDRINRVINLPSFTKWLNWGGKDLIDFQLAWSRYKSIEDMPDCYRRAIIRCEEELESNLSH